MFRHMLERLSEYRRRQQAMAELYALDDRSLADIGITRAEIPYLIARSAEPAPVKSKLPFEALRHA